MNSVRSRVLVVEHHPFVRRGIAETLAAEPDLQCAAEADSAVAALRILRESDFDLMVIDTCLPDLSGLDLVRRVRTSDARTPILVLSVHDEAVHAARALSAGACGYLAKQEAAERLVAAARKLLAGGIYVSNTIERLLLERRRHGAGETSAY